MSKIANIISESCLETADDFKRNYANYLNLASNEMVSENVLTIFNDFWLTLTEFNWQKYANYEQCYRLWQKRYDLDDGQMVFFAGSDQAIYIILSLLSLKKNSVLLQTPNYYNYQRYARMLEIPIFEIEFLEKSSQTFVNDIIATLDRIDVSIIVLTIPDSYLGRVIENCDLIMLIEITQKRGIYVMLDLAYADYDTNDIIKNFSKIENFILLKSFSKSFGISGLRFACTITAPELSKQIKKAGSEKCLSKLTMEFSSYILQHEEKFLAIRNNIVLYRDALINALKASCPKWDFSVSKSNFFTINVFDEVVCDAIFEEFLKLKIYIRQLKSFHHSFANYLRITVCDDPKIIETVKNILKNSYENIYSATKFCNL